MSQLLQPLSIFDFTPPTSPTKLSNPMKWLTRTPTSMPLPSSPTKSREGSDDDSKSSSSTDSATLIQSNFTKAMRSLQKRSSTFSLQPKASSSSLKATPLDTPQREFPHWFARPSPSHAITSASPASELADHFARSLPNYEEKQAELRRRKEASQKRVQGMRAYLGTAERTNGLVYKAQEASANPPHPLRVHQRYDSGSHEHADSAALQEPQKRYDTHTSDQTSPLDQSFLYHALFRLRCRPPLQFACVGCKQTHRNSIQDSAPPTWLVTSCRHYVYSGCFNQLRDDDAPDMDACVHCAHLQRRLKQLSREETEANYKRLLEATRGVGCR